MVEALLMFCVVAALMLFLIGVFAMLPLPGDVRQRARRRRRVSGRARSA